MQIDVVNIEGQKVGQMDIVEPGADWFTDKMPLNETHLGLIALLFPEAPLIHVIRHPLDVMVSAISNHFTHGFFCAAELDTAAEHYVRVMDLVQHYRAEMTLRYLPIRYEDMIDDQEPTVRAILEFIGAGFDPRCLAFHENRRYARTASYAGDREALRQFALPLPPLPRAPRVGHSDPSTSDRAPRLHGGLALTVMEQRLVQTVIARSGATKQSRALDRFIAASPATTRPAAPSSDTGH